jgi:hypothetical protein
MSACAASVAVARQHFDQLARTVLKSCERFICRDRDFEDLRQEGLGRTWEWYSRQVAGGSVPDTALVVHACRLAMVNRGRSLVGHNHRPHRDVFDRQGVDLELRRLDGIPDADDDPPRGHDPTIGFARLGIRDPNDHVISAIDLAAWLDSLASVDREMVEMRGAGHDLVAIGKATGRSTAGVFRRVRSLGVDLAAQAGLDVPLPSRRRRSPSSSGGPAPAQIGLGP